MATVLTDTPSVHFLRVQRYHLDRFVARLASQVPECRVQGTPTRLDRAYRVHVSVDVEHEPHVERQLRRLRTREGFALDWDWRRRRDDDDDDAGAAATERVVMLRFAEERPPYDRMLAALVRTCLVVALFAVLHVIHPDLYWPHGGGHGNE